MRCLDVFDLVECCGKGFRQRAGFQSSVFKTLCRVLYRRCSKSHLTLLWYTYIQQNGNFNACLQCSAMWHKWSDLSDRTRPFEAALFLGIYQYEFQRCESNRTIIRFPIRRPQQMQDQEPVTFCIPIGNKIIIFHICPKNLLASYNIKFLVHVKAFYRVNVFSTLFFWIL